MRKTAGIASRWAAAGAWAAAIFALSHSPTLPKGPEIPGLDKIMHAGVYAILAWLLFRALAAGRGPIRIQAWPLAVVLAFLYGVSDEVHQAFIPGRSCDTFDALADLFGGVLAWGAHISLFRRARERRKPPGRS